METPGLLATGWHSQLVNPQTWAGSCSLNTALVEFKDLSPNKILSTSIIATRHHVCVFKIHNMSLGNKMAHKLRHGPNSWLESGNKLVPHFCHMTGKQGIGRGHASLCRAWEVEVQAQPGSVTVLTDSSSPDLLRTAKEGKKFNTAARTRIRRDKATPTYDVHSRQCNLSDIQLKSDSREKPQHKNPFVLLLQCLQNSH